MNTEIDATDRTGCKAWCGRTDQRPGYDGLRVDGDHQADFRYWDPADGCTPAELRGKPMWCKGLCRDARLPPIAAPQHSAAMAKLEIKTTVDGKCPLCGVAVPSTHIHFCSPQHVERRKGQRWRCEWMMGNLKRVVEATLVSRIGGSDWRTDNRDDPAWNEARWRSSSLAFTLTLIADAPAEPWKPTTPQCESFCRPGLRCKYCTTEVAMPAPPAQEAPKAAPVQPGLVVEMPCDGCGETNDVEWFQVDNMTRVFCEPCRIEALVWMSAQAGTPYKGPERLSNVLARDEQIESDCLGEIR